ncbi:hypothetical protein IAQ61_001161, partial [Plenodomus lingam]|uniref:Predicted protein n=1 Tax=Leptosphaeria maculans (strain JN3 / isolate v23.1.3 / race Av1-4-5-6-7-8) TaxID=985895 RepID=E5A1R1_LEPMJ
MYEYANDTRSTVCCSVPGTPYPEPNQLSGVDPELSCRDLVNRWWITDRL